MKRLKNKKMVLIFILVCATITIVIKAYCSTPITLKSVSYTDNNGVTRTYSFYPDCIRYHIKANGYNKKLKEEVDNNLYAYAAPGPGRELQETNAKMQGYGNYVFKEDTNLFNFIDFCYKKNPQMAIACALYSGVNETSSCDYTKLCTYSGKKLNSNGITFVNNFWSNMVTQLGEVFNNYQDVYFFEKYTNKGASLVYTPNRLSNNGAEFITCMMSYLFSTNQNSASSFELKKGDIVPFLYIKDCGKIKENGKNKYNISDSIKNNPKEVAKYAYLACISGWTDATSNDLWLEEYELIFGEYKEEELCDNIDMSIEELEVLYYEIDELYQSQKGNKGNALLGATIDTIIQSDYSISQQLEATDWYLQNFEGIGNYKENMARNELMARYMMENSPIGDIIKDYNVGITFITENLQRDTSESKNTNTIILSDFQVLEFEHKLNKDVHSDDDGISDLVELTGKVNGNIETDNIRWVDVTVPLRKTYVSKHGNEEGFDAELIRLFKANGGSLDKNNNKVRIGHFDFNNGRGYYRTTDYDSNPMLNDTDFDGLMDNIDANKINGNFKGYASGIGNVDFVSDFRYFFIDNKKYNDELSAMSLIMCNLANGGSAPLHSGSQSISQYMQNLGFINPIKEKDSFRISTTENISGNLYLSKKTIQVGANKKTIKRYKDIYGVFLGGFDTEENYKKLLVNFDKEEVVRFYENIADDIIEYINANKPPTVNGYCYWVTGYSIAGGIAGEVASRLANNNEVFCYTFGATNTNTTGSGAYACIKNVINEDDLYHKIHNVEDGFHRSGMLYNDSIYDNLQREYKNLVGNAKDYKVTPKRTNTIKQKIQQVRKIVNKDDWISMWLTNLSKYLMSYTTITDTFNDILHPFQSYDSVQLKTILNNNTTEVKKAHELKSYYVLSKSLNGFDLNNEDVGWTEYDETLGSEEYVDELTEEDEEYQERLNLLLEAIETVGRAYLDNVYTYQGADDTMWDIETRITDLETTRNAGHVTEIITGQERVLKTSTTNAYEKWNEHKLRIKDKYYQDITFDEYKQKRIMPMVPYDDNKKSLHYLDIFDSYTGGKYNKSIYNFDKDIIVYNDPNDDKDDKINKRQYVSDDCSSFATAVYWYYLNQIEGANDLNDIDLWYTGSSYFIPNNNHKKSTKNEKLSILEILLNNNFELFMWDDTEKYDEDYNIKLRNDFELQKGDLLYRKSQNGKNAHVEFYLGEKHSFGWGEIHSSYENKNESKHFKIIRDLDIYNIGKTIKASSANEGDVYRIENKNGGGIYNTIYRKTDNNCRYDYVIRLGKKSHMVEVGNE